MATKWEITKEQLTAQIVDAAIMEFGEHGYNATKLADIAKRAGTSAAVIIKYFETKENLYLSLVSRYPVLRYFDDGSCETVSDVFNAYLDIFKRMLKEDRRIFDLWSLMVDRNDVPDSAFKLLKENYSGSPMEQAVIEAQQAGDMPQGDPWEYYVLLSTTTLSLLRNCDSIGIEPPGNDSILNIIQYNPDKSRLVRLSREKNLLVDAINTLYPLSVFCNLSENRYQMIDSGNPYDKRSVVSGVYDELIAKEAAVIPDPLQSRKLADSFSRENLLKLHSEGKKELSVVHLYVSEDGSIHWMLSKVVLIESNGDICSIRISQDVDEEVARARKYIQEMSDDMQSRLKHIEDLKEEIKKNISL